jgi:hypothetical protein
MPYRRDHPRASRTDRQRLTWSDQVYASPNSHPSFMGYPIDHPRDFTKRRLRLYSSQKWKAGLPKGETRPWSESLRAKSVPSFNSWRNYASSWPHLGPWHSATLAPNRLKSEWIGAESSRQNRTMKGACEGYGGSHAPRSLEREGQSHLRASSAHYGTFFFRHCHRLLSLHHLRRDHANVSHAKKHMTPTRKVPYAPKSAGNSNIARAEETWRRRIFIHSPLPM